MKQMLANMFEHQLQVLLERHPDVGLVDLNVQLLSTLNRADSPYGTRHYFDVPQRKVITHKGAFPIVDHPQLLLAFLEQWEVFERDVISSALEDPKRIEAMVSRGILGE